MISNAADPARRERAMAAVDEHLVHRADGVVLLFTPPFDAEPPHVGRGGWTWYTGSAGWMYRAGLESILGFRLRGERLVIDPCIPRAWPGFELVFRYRSTRYDIVVANPEGVSRGVSSVEVDGVTLDGDLSIRLADDRQTHRVRIGLG